MQNQGQTIRAHSILQRKREKVNRKYTQPARPRRQLSPGFLEDALDEVGILLLSCFFWQLDCHVIISYWCKCAISVTSIYPAKCIIPLKSEGRGKKIIKSLCSVNICDAILSGLYFLGVFKFWQHSKRKSVQLTSFPFCFFFQQLNLFYELLHAHATLICFIYHKISVKWFKLTPVMS